MNIKTTLVRICFLVIVIMYLIMGTGLHGDDYSEIVRWKSQGFFDFLGISGFQLFFFGSYYVFWWAYPLLGFEHQWVYDLMKVVSHMLSLFCVYRFAIDYLPRDRAMLASAVFVFYPLHDTTMYWYMTAPYIFFPAVTMLAHAMIRNDRLVFGLLLAFIGAFAGYFSPPYLFGLAAVFLMERQLKKAALFVFPGVLYVTYYFYIKFAYSGLEQRINSSLTVADYLKQLVLQPFSFIDAAVGPSYWLKVYYAIGSIGLASGLFVLCIVVFLFIKVPFFSKRPDFPRYLVGGLFCIVVKWTPTGRQKEVEFKLVA